MYYLFIASIITTVVVFLLKKRTHTDDGYRNCSQYTDSFGNLTIETHNYIYKMSHYDGRLYRRIKGSDDDIFKLVICNLDRKNIPKGVKSVILVPKTGVGKFIK